MISRDDWTTRQASATVIHNQQQGGIEAIADALREMAGELLDPSIEVVDIQVHWDRVNSGSITITVQR